MTRRFFFGAPEADDSGSLWADELLAPMRSQVIDLDVAPAVMRRIAAHRPAPAPAALPGRWPGVAWAASMVLGLVCLGLLLATLGVMVFGGDEGARAAWALVASSGRVAATLLASAVGTLAAFVSAALTTTRGAWTIIEALAPLVRGAGALVAIAGLLSMAFSAHVFNQARRAAPVAAPRDISVNHGGLS